jgi:hypothetical protein
LSDQTTIQLYKGFGLLDLLDLLVERRLLASACKVLGTDDSALKVKKEMDKSLTTEYLAPSGNSAAVCQSVLNTGRPVKLLYMNPKDFGCPQDRPRFYWIHASPTYFKDPAALLDAVVENLDAIRQVMKHKRAALRDVILPDHNDFVTAYLLEMQTQRKVKKGEEAAPDGSKKSKLLWPEMHKKIYKNEKFAWTPLGPVDPDDDAWLSILTDRERCKKRFVETLLGPTLLADGSVRLVDLSRSKLLCVITGKCQLCRRHKSNYHASSCAAVLWQCGPGLINENRLLCKISVQIYSFNYMFSRL